MSIPEAIKGAQAELARVHSPLQRVQRLAVYARIFAAELFGTVLAVPFGVRAYSLHRSLPDARKASGRAGTVSILRDVSYGPRPRTNLDIYLPPNIELRGGSSQLLERGSVWGSGEDSWGGAGAAGTAAGEGLAAAGAAEAETPSSVVEQQQQQQGKEQQQGQHLAAEDGEGPGRGSAAPPASASASASAAAAAPEAAGAPVVLFCHGGVWASGSKWHYAPLAARLAQAGVVTAVMSYSLYPQAMVPQMVAEVSRALTWTMDNAEQLGGSPQKVSLVGHSAGAHLCTMVLLHRALAASKAAQQAQQAQHGEQAADAGSSGGKGAGGEGTAAAAVDQGAEEEEEEEAAAFADHRMPQRLVGVAGVYDLAKHYEYEEARHVHKLSTMERAVGGNHLFPAFSPATILANAIRRWQQQPQIQQAGQRAKRAQQAGRTQQAQQADLAHTSSWEELAADPRELLKEAGVAGSGAQGGVGWNGGGAVSSAAAAGQAAAGPACTLVDPELEVAAAAAAAAAVAARGPGGACGQPELAGTADVTGAAPPAVAAARYYQSFHLAGEAIARRIGFDRVAAAEAAAAAAAAAAGAPRRAAAAAAARAVPATATPLSATAVVGAANGATASGGQSSSGQSSGGQTGGQTGPWRIFELSVDAARRLPPIVLTSSCSDLTVPWYESAEMYWMLHDCGVPAKHLVYNKVSHGDFVTQWAALPRISGRAAEGEGDLAAHAADLVKIVSGRAEVRYN